MTLFLGWAAVAAGQPGASWQTPPQGAVEMFRQMPRAFAVGVGGAGGKAIAAPAPSGAESDGAAPAAASPSAEAEHGRTITFRIAPFDTRDEPEGPAGREIVDGTVALYRPGSFVPGLVAPTGVPFLLPPGRWVWMAEAEGWVSSFTSSEEIPHEVLRGEQSPVIPVVPACRLAASDDPRWARLERVDVVSLDQNAVYPLVPRHRRELWVPAGRYLAYAVSGGAITGISGIAACEQSERKELPVPEPPGPDRQSLLATLRLPEAVAADERERLLALLEDAVDVAARPPVAPTAAVWQGRMASLFFLDVPAERALSLQAAHPLLRTKREPLEPLGGSVREVALGELAERRDYEVGIDYRPARAHREERLELLSCGGERDDSGDEILVYRCRTEVAEAPLRPGPQTYVFPDLDDGQYLLTAVVDDDWVAGLGRDVAPFLDPADDLPPPVEIHPLVELEVYGHLLRDGEAGPGRCGWRPGTKAPAFPRARQRRTRTCSTISSTSAARSPRDSSSTSRSRSATATRRSCRGSTAASVSRRAATAASAAPSTSIRPSPAAGASTSICRGRRR